MKKYVILTLLFCLTLSVAYPFCGFYVAKADANLFNKKSQVILVRDGARTVVTMSNDFQGDVKDFAMVVPVPTVLKEKDIKVVNRGLFDQIDTYSAPRMAEYYDANPCQQIYEMSENRVTLECVSISKRSNRLMTMSAKKHKVKIEAQYSIEEYDILILSAKESDGLKNWLIENDYRMPEGAEEVLEPYIKNNMKFFVVKVDLNKLPKSQQGYLRPIQIAYESDKFMLPIRLGMANSDGEQDMIVYGFTKTGRIECANYRTVKLPTDRDIPQFIKTKNEFGDFYVDLFKKEYDRQARKAVFLEYAWDVSPRVTVKCDPCVGTPPATQQFVDAGIDWATDSRGASNVFFTRLHIRYSRDKFPQDLQFQVTPNKERFQCRYVIHNPARGGFECEAGQEYISDLKNRRELEVQELTALTGWENKRFQRYINEYDKYLLAEVETEEDDQEMIPIVPILPGGKWPMIFILSSIACVASIGWRSRSRQILS